MDAASHRGIEDVRDLRETIAFAPVQGRFKVYIIDEVHMLTREAFNALLKTLEEPPGNVVFVLATTEPHKIPETIISRCQRFDFRRPQVGDIARLLRLIVERENARPDEERGGPRIEIQDAALLEIARHSQGGFRDAIGTLDKLITYAEGAIRPADVLDALGVTDADLLFEITDIVAERHTAEALQFVQRLANEGTDYSQFIRDLLRHLRQLFLLQHLQASAEDEAALRALGQTVELDEQLLGRLLPQAHQLHPREIVHFIETLGARAERDPRRTRSAAPARAGARQGDAAAGRPHRGRPGGAPAPSRSGRWRRRRWPPRAGRATRDAASGRPAPTGEARRADITAARRGRRSPTTPRRGRCSRSCRAGAPRPRAAQSSHWSA